MSNFIDFFCWLFFEFTFDMKHKDPAIVYPAVHEYCKILLAHWLTVRLFVSGGIQVHKNTLSRRLCARVPVP